MSYNMQLANEKSEAEKNKCYVIKEYNLTNNNIKDIN